MKNLFLFFFVIALSGCSGNHLTGLVLKEQLHPVYPYEARAGGIEGNALVLFSINEKGEVNNSKIIKSSGSDILDSAALEYTQKLKFEPSSIGGKNFPVFVKWLVTFKLEEKEMKEKKINLLVFSKTTEYRHESIDAGKEAFKILASENNFNIDFSEDSTFFNNDNLSQYDVVLFLNTSGNILDEEGKKAFKKFIMNNGGFVGLHGAADTEYQWAWYGELIGTYFKDHPKVQKATIKVTNRNHPSTKDLPYKWERVDEWYNFTKPLPHNIKVLAFIDETTYEGGTNGLNHPFCWYHEFDGGRAWYTAGGHTVECYSDPLFLKHILGGIRYAAGLE